MSVRSFRHHPVVVGDRTRHCGFNLGRECLQRGAGGLRWNSSYLRALRADARELDDVDLLYELADFEEHARAGELATRDALLAFAADRERRYRPASQAAEFLGGLVNGANRYG